MSTLLLAVFWKMNTSTRTTRTRPRMSFGDTDRPWARGACASSAITQRASARLLDEVGHHLGGYLPGDLADLLVGPHDQWDVGVVDGDEGIVGHTAHGRH